MAISASSVNLAAVVSAAGGSPLQVIQTDIGVTLGAGSTVTNWADIGGQGLNYSAVSAPTYGASNVNGFKSILFDSGSSNVMSSALTLPAPGTTPTYVCLIFKPLTWANNNGIIGQNSTTGAHVIYQNGSSPATVAFNATNSLANNGAALGSWVMLEAQYTDTIQDYLKIGSGAPVSGINTGNNASVSARLIGKSLSTGACGNFEILALLYLSGIVGNPVRNALRKAIRFKYAGIVAA